MIEKIAKNIVKLQVKFPLVFIAVIVILSVLLVPGIFNLVNNVEPSLEKVLPQDIKEIKTMNTMRTQFGADMMYLVVYPEGPVYDARSPDLLRYIDILAQKIRTREYILEVNTLADIVKEMNEGNIPDNDEMTEHIISLHPMSTQYINHDYSFNVIRIRSDTGASADLINQVVLGIEEDIASVEEYNPGARIEITGFNAIDKATFEVIISDFGFITIISMVLVMIVVLITFRSFVKGMIPMLVVINALIWTMGISGYLGLTITVVSMVSAAMIMGLGIDFGIHVVHNYFNLRKKLRPKEALTETMSELLRAMLGASLTTVAGFLALLFGVLPAMKVLGIILALGILTTLIGAVFLLPPVLYLYDLSTIK